MSMFASKTPRDLNRDPEPYYDIDRRLRYADAPAGTDYYFRYEPRPEFDHVQHNEPNEILVSFRAGVEADPAHDWITTYLVTLPDWTHGEVAHARKVLTRLARLIE